MPEEINPLIDFNEDLGHHTYYVYILTNAFRSTFYIGVTNNLAKRLQQHREGIAEDGKSFTSKYNVQHLVYYETYSWVQNAIAREKELKRWRRDKKLALIKANNDTFEFLEYLFPFNGN